MDNLPSSEATQEAGGQSNVQTELGHPAASMSVAKMNLLLQKGQSSGVNTSNPSAIKRRKSSGLSPQILMRILSPRTGRPGASSPSVGGNGATSDSLGNSRMITAHELAQVRSNFNIIVVQCFVQLQCVALDSFFKLLKSN
jgi:hypothetical protein